jgi:hypothetical protein
MWVVIKRVGRKCPPGRSLRIISCSEVSRRLRETGGRRARQPRWGTLPVSYAAFGPVKAPGLCQARWPCKRKGLGRIASMQCGRVIDAMQPGESASPPNDSPRWRELTPCQPRTSPASPPNRQGAPGALTTPRAKGMGKLGNLPAVSPRLNHPAVRPSNKRDEFTKSTTRAQSARANRQGVARELKRGFCQGIHARLDSRQL